MVLAVGNILGLFNVSYSRTESRCYIFLHYVARQGQIKEYQVVNLLVFKHKKENYKEKKYRYSLQVLSHLQSEWELVLYFYW